MGTTFAADAASLSVRAQELWPKTITPYLQQPLWRPASAYNATHFMLVPLEASFVDPNPRYRADFAAHFKALNEHYDEVTTSDALSRLQYLYLASRFIALAHATHQVNLVPPELPGKIAADVLRYWTREPAWQWERSPFPGGIRERVRWKLDTRPAGKSYLRAILDEEIYVFAIAADLYTARGDFPALHAVAPDLSAIIATAVEAFKQRVAWQPDGGWLFQPGVWRDHPDFAYAGHRAKSRGLRPAPVDVVAEDTSHSHRMPAWLVSLDAGERARATPDAAYFGTLIDGLRRQFIGHVLVAPTADFPGYRTTNFMDGSNGLYRWGYSSFGPDRGYGPFEASGTLMMGWWSLLGGSQIAEAYAKIAGSFPLPNAVALLYTGPPGKSQPENSTEVAAWLTNGLAEEITNLAALVASSSVR